VDWRSEEGAVARRGREGFFCLERSIFHLFFDEVGWPEEMKLGKGVVNGRKA
jgi:hypothetical protein